MKLKHVGIIVVSVLAMSSAAVSAAEGDESVTTTVNGGVIHFKGEVVNAACAIDSESMNQTVELGQVRSSRLAKAGDLSSAVGFNIKLNTCCYLKYLLGSKVFLSKENQHLLQTH